MIPTQTSAPVGARRPGMEGRPGGVPGKDTAAGEARNGASDRMGPTPRKRDTMSTTTKKAAIGGAAAVVVAGLAFGLAAPAAVADPAIPGPLPYRTLVAVGSDTIQDLGNGLANAAKDSYNYPSVFASYDATGSSTIQTRAGGDTFNRPNGSTAGMRALKSSILEDGLYAQPDSVDIARVSSAPPLGAGSPSDLTYVPVALDAVTWAASSSFQSAISVDLPKGSFVGEGQTAGADLTLGTTDDVYDLTLTNIFGLDNGDATTGVNLTDGVNTFVLGSQATSGADIIPFKPQAGSGTLQFWQGQIGGTYSDLVADDYTDGSGTHDVQEHDGSVTAAIPEAIIPFSIAQGIAQGNSIPGVTDRRHGALLGYIDGYAPTTGSPAVLNTSFPITRDVYLVAETARLTGSSTDPDDLALRKFLRNVSGGDAPFVCDLDSTITQYGFGESANCGTIAGYRTYASLY